ncbi:hypothetical protein FRB90_003866 [Tulasnella sp. 427]|nr:hypothetical protein FRB90_003866 [Tulasnella sp. 427]
MSINSIAQLIIPRKMERQPKTLILCFDGTSNSFNDENTNVVRLFSALEKNEMDKQMCYYQPGIGTYVAPNSVWSPTWQGLAKILDAGLAWYLDAHIMGGYRFLMENYEQGDKICLFGFSRGAYTARCLAGMLNKVGLLPKSNEEQVSFAYKKYKDTTASGKIAAQGFKNAFSRSVDIEFVGVWDTVSSVGFFSRHLPFTASNTIIKTFRHALALDEHRAKFKPNPWHRAAPTAAAAKNDPDKGTAVKAPPKRRPGTLFERISDGIEEGVRYVGEEVARVEGVVEERVKMKTGLLKKRKRTVFSVESAAIDDGKSETDVKEVWFAGMSLPLSSSRPTLETKCTSRFGIKIKTGCHADVGGGSASNNTTNTLANPSLMWMVNEIITARAPILFKPYAFADVPAFETMTTTLTDKTPKHRVAVGAGQGFNLFTASPTGTIRGSTFKGAPTPPATDSPGTAPIPRATLQLETPLNSGPTSPVEGLTVVQVLEGDPRLDANAEMYDQLQKKWAWWILEVIPLWQYYQDGEGHWHKGF